MLPLSRYAPGAYPPNLGFPQLGGAEMQRYFKKHDALQQNHLAGMTERKQGLKDIHRRRVEDQMPAALEPKDPLEEWYDLGDQGPDERDDAVPTEEIQRNIEQLRRRHSYGLRPRVDGRASNQPTGYNLQQRVKGSYVSGKFVPVRTHKPLHTTYGS